MTKKTALIVSIALILAGCSGSGIVRRAGEGEGLKRLMESAGAPVDSVPCLIRYEGWQPLATNKVAVWATASDGYLLTVAQPCAELQSADQVQLTSRSALVRRGWTRSSSRGRVAASRRSDSSIFAIRDGSWWGAESALKWNTSRNSTGSFSTGERSIRNRGLTWWNIAHSCCWLIRRWR